MSPAATEIAASFDDVMSAGSNLAHLAAIYAHPRTRPVIQIAARCAMWPIPDASIELFNLLDERRKNYAALLDGGSLPTNVSESLAAKIASMDCDIADRVGPGYLTAAIKR